MFQIYTTELTWIDGKADDPNDLCLHGKAIAKIGDEVFEYNATVSSTSLYLLKSLTEDHIIYESNQMFPCCGFSMYANENMDYVDIIGCPNGVDWSIIHVDNRIKLITETGKETIIDFSDYKQAVYSFVDKIEDFYLKSTPKIIPDDNVDRDGYMVFWSEWHKRRKQLL